MTKKDLKKEICSFWKTDLGGSKKQEKEKEENILALKDGE